MPFWSDSRLDVQMLFAQTGFGGNHRCLCSLKDRNSRFGFLVLRGGVVVMYMVFVNWWAVVIGQGSFYVNWVVVNYSSTWGHVQFSHGTRSPKSGVTLRGAIASRTIYACLQSSNGQLFDVIVHLSTLKHANDFYIESHYRLTGVGTRSTISFNLKRGASITLTWQYRVLENTRRPAFRCIWSKYKLRRVTYCKLQDGRRYRI